MRAHKKGQQISTQKRRRRRKQERASESKREQERAREEKREEERTKKRKRERERERERRESFLRKTGFQKQVSEARFRLCARNTVRKKKKSQPRAEDDLMCATTRPSSNSEAEACPCVVSLQLDAF